MVYQFVLMKPGMCLMGQSLFMSLQGGTAFVEKQSTLPSELEKSVAASISILLDSSAPVVKTVSIYFHGTVDW